MGKSRIDYMEITHNQMQLIGNRLPNNVSVLCCLFVSNTKMFHLMIANEKCLQLAPLISRVSCNIHCRSSFVNDANDLGRFNEGVAKIGRVPVIGK